MFNGMFDEYEARIKSTAAVVGATATAYAERICAKLDAIHEAVTDPEFDNRTEDFEASILAAGPVATITVPPGEDWELVHLAAEGDPSIVIRHGSRLRGKWLSGGSVAVSPGLLLRGGSEFTVSVSADTYVYAQFRVRKPRPGRTTKATGMVLPEVTGDNPVDENVGRHGPGDVTRHPIKPTGDAPMA